MGKAVGKGKILTRGDEKAPPTKKITKKPKALKKPQTVIQRLGDPRAVEKFIRCFQNTKIAPEKGIDLDEVDEYVKKVVADRKWGKFVEHPAVTPNTSIVAEFYARLYVTPLETDNVKIRGKMVDISSETINKFYDLEDVGIEEDWESSIDNLGENNELYEHMRMFLCPKHSFVYDRNDGVTPVYILTKGMDHSNRVLFSFMAGRLSPKTHVSDIKIPDLKLLYCIFQNCQIDVGRIINAKMRDYATQAIGNLAFPSLITSLCMQAGVKSLQSDICERSIPPPITKTILTQDQPVLKQKKKVTVKSSRKPSTFQAFRRDMYRAQIKIVGCMEEMRKALEGDRMLLTALVGHHLGIDFDMSKIAPIHPGPFLLDPFVGETDDVEATTEGEEEVDEGATEEEEEDEDDDDDDDDEEEEVDEAATEENEDDDEEEEVDEATTEEDEDDD